MWTPKCICLKKNWFEPFPWEWSASLPFQYGNTQHWYSRSFENFSQRRCQHSRCSFRINWQLLVSWVHRGSFEFIQGRCAHHIRQWPRHGPRQARAILLLAQPNNFKQQTSRPIWIWQQTSRNHTYKFGRACNKVLFCGRKWDFPNNGELPQNFTHRSLLPSRWWNSAWFSAHMGTKCNQSPWQWNHLLHCSFSCHSMHIEWTDHESNSFGTSV